MYNCSQLPFILDASVRLVDGTNEREGRVEIMYQGIWGTICDDGWDDIDATVVCRQLGYSHGVAKRQAQFGSGTGPVWLRRVNCLGNESKLSHCIHTGAGNTLGCSHAQDIGVQCSGLNGTITCILCFIIQSQATLQTLIIILY